MIINCPICDEIHKLTALKVKSGIYRCNSCSHAFTILAGEKEVQYNADYFSRIHKNYFNIPDVPLFNFIRSEILKLAGEKPIRLLDCGCGKGTFLKYMLAEGPAAELSGIDLIDIQQHPDIHFIKGDFFTEAFKTNFNVICSIETIEHINKPHLFIQKIKEVLQPGGFIFLSTINSSSLIYKVAQLLDKLKLHKPFDRLYSYHHLNHYTNKSLKKLTKMNGLKVILLKNCNPPLKSIDIPEDKSFLEKMYRFFVWVIFLFSSIFTSGMRQVIVCRLPSPL